VCNCAENRQYIGAAFYKQDGTYIGWQYINNNKKWKIPDGCYWTIISLCGMSTDSVPLSFTEIGLYEAETLQQFEPYREPIVTSHTLAEPINGTVSYKDGMLRPLSVCKGTNIVSIDGVKNSDNLFNAKTGRVIKERVGSWDPSGVRSNMDGTGIHIGLCYGNYYIPDMVKGYEIFDDNSLTVTSSSDYGVAFEFIVEPEKYYMLSFERTEGNGAVWVLFFDENGKYINQGCISSDATYEPTPFIVPKGTYYALITFLNYGSTVVTSAYKNIQLEKGTIPTAYEPYRPKTNMSILY
jgi:hypothetical protein